MALVTRAPSPGIVTAAHLVYALHSLSLLIGIVTAATIIGAFVFGWPSIVAVIINYVKRGDAVGTYIESHFRWQIRTFWYALLWGMVGLVVLLTLIGIPVALAIWFGTGIWAIYRIVKGWLALKDGRPMYAG